MCGRYTLTTDGDALVEAFGFDTMASWTPRYNIAPTQTVLAIRRTPDGEEAIELHWGLVPFWAKDRKIGSRMINARAETVAEKPSFRNAFTKRRCLVVADGYYEWAKHDGAKQPYHIHRHDRRPFTFAGLWERWQDESGDDYLSCTIVTTAASPALASLHHRMPVVIGHPDREAWLAESSAPDALLELLDPARGGEFETTPVSTYVNSPAHDGPDCIKALAA